MRPELGDRNKHWVIRSTLEHGLPVVDLVFEFEIGNPARTVKPLDYAVRETLRWSDDILARDQSER